MCYACDLANNLSRISHISPRPLCAVNTSDISYNRRYFDQTPPPQQINWIWSLNFAPCPACFGLFLKHSVFFASRALVFQWEWNSEFRLLSIGLINWLFDCQNRNNYDFYWNRKPIISVEAFPICSLLRHPITLQHNGLPTLPPTHNMCVLLY